MSVWAEVSTTTVNWYCNETADNALCSNNADGMSEINGLSSTYFPVDIDESYIDNILVSELHQMLETELITRFLDIPEFGTAHQDTLNWMLKVHAYNRFRPETAYLSANNFHCFILSHTLQPFAMVKGCYNLIKQNMSGKVLELDATMPGKRHTKKCCRKDLKSSQDMSPSKC